MSDAQKKEIEAEARQVMPSLKGDKVDSFTKRRMAMESDESTEVISGSYKEITEGQAKDNIQMAGVWSANKKAKMKDLLDNIIQMTEFIDREARAFFDGEYDEDLVDLERAVTKVYRTL